MDEPVTHNHNQGWWTGQLGYEVFVRSFADANGDGRGDLVGVTRRLDHLVGLGVDLVALTPFFASPGHDDGYDVADHRAVAADLGTLDDLDELVSTAHDRGLRVLIDLVPNHTSDQHPWFVASRSSVDDPHRGFYHWREPGPDGGPPNNWVSHRGGPAWTFDEASEQYYLHLFRPEQPDLNWNHPGVVRAFDDILRFWLERGVDGFRIDMAHGLVKNMLMPNNPLRYPVTADMTPAQAFAAYEHRYDLDQAGNAAIYRRWRDIAASYDALLIGEVYLRVNDASRVSRYVRRADGLHRAFSFAPVHVPWEPRALWDCFRDALDEAPTDLAWSASSRDDPRAATRFGGGDLGRRRALAYLALLCALPGLPFLYQGDEIVLESEPGTDPATAARRPMPWDELDTTTLTGPDATTVSPLERMRRLVEVRRRRRELADPAHPVHWLTARADPVLAFRRGDTVCAVNAGDEPTSLELPDGSWTVVYSSADPRRDDVAVDGSSVALAAPEAVLIARSSG